MALNPSIILAGQQPDFLGTIDRANQAAARATDMRRQNMLAQIYNQQGAGLVAGDQSAVNALAGLDPLAALDVQQTHRSNRVQDQEIARRNEVQDRDFGLRVQEYRRKVGDAEAAAEAARIEQGVLRATQLYQAGDLQGINALLQSVGEQPLSDLSQFPALASMYNQAATALKTHGDLTGGPKDTAKEQQIARVMETGVDRDTAIKIADGVYKVLTDPVTRESVIVDLATRQIVSEFGDAQQPAPQAAAAPQAAQTSADLGFGGRFEGADTSFGAEGFARRVINTGADIIGADQPYPETSGAQRDFAVMREDLTSKIQNAYDGRVPAFLLEGIQNLTPRAGSPWEGAGGAQDKLRALGRNLHQELQSVRQSQERKLSPADAEALARRQQVLESSLQQVSEALRGFAPDTQVRPDVADRLKAYQ